LPLNLDPGTFGGTNACHILIEKMNATDDAKFAAAVVGRFNAYFEEIGELLKLNSPTRNRMIELAFKSRYAEALEVLAPRFEAYGIPFTYFHNIMLHRRRQAEDHGKLLEKFRGEDREHNEVLYALRMLAKAKATGQP
jgi:hypothetical protein